MENFSLQVLLKVLFIDNFEKIKNSEEKSCFEKNMFDDLNAKIKWFSIFFSFS